jgi:hypothetical protein
MVLCICGLIFIGNKAIIYYIEINTCWNIFKKMSGFDLNETPAWKVDAKLKHKESISKIKEYIGQIWEERQSHHSLVPSSMCPNWTINSPNHGSWVIVKFVTNNVLKTKFLSF